MRHANIFSALILIMPLLGSCTSGNLDINRNIRVTVRIPNDSDRTKALLESDDIRTVGTTVRFYGFTDGTAADIPGHNLSNGEPGSTNLSAGLSLYYNGAAWEYRNAAGTASTGEAYQWVSGKSHRFFGWLDNDAKSGLTATGFFGSGFTFTCTDGTGTLAIPAKAMGISDENMDFAYSDVVVRSATGGDFSNVELPLQHLFASFSLGARNYTTSQITIKSVSLSGLYDQRGASVTFGSDTAAVVYGTGSMMADQSLLTADVSLSKADVSGDRKINIVKGASDSPKYFLVWPQTEGTIDDAEIEVTYAIGSGEDQTAHIALPYDSEFTNAARNGWGAGVRRNMELSFHDKEVRLGVYADNWNEKEPVVDFNGSILVSQTLRIAEAYTSNCIAGTTPGEYYFTATRIPIVLEFKFDQPANSTWLVSKNGDFDAFNIVNFENDGPAEGVIDPDAGLSRIAIYPPTGELSKNEYRLSLSFAVRKNSGEMENVPDLQMYGEGNPVMTFILLK